LNIVPDHISGSVIIVSEKNDKACFTDTTEYTYNVK